MKISTRGEYGFRAMLYLALVTAAGCGLRSPDPKAEGHGMPIEITEERPVDAPGTAPEELPPQ